MFSDQTLLVLILHMVLGESIKCLVHIKCAKMTYGFSSDYVIRE